MRDTNDLIDASKTFHIYNLVDRETTKTSKMLRQMTQIQ